MGLEQNIDLIAADTQKIHEFVHSAPGIVNTDAGAIVNLAMASQRILEMASFLPTGIWSPGHDYVFRNIIEYAGVFYMVLSDHKAGIFADDLADGKLCVFQAAITFYQLENALSTPGPGSGVDMVSRATKHLDTLVNLDTEPGHVSKSIYIRGNISDGDGAEGVFTWNPALEDAPIFGMIHQVDGVAIGRWVRHVPNGIVDIRMTGARLGQDDNSDAIQRAVLAGYSGVYVPEGVWKILKTIMINRTVEFFGVGVGSVIDATSDAFVGDTALYFYGGGFSALPNLAASVAVGDRKIVFSSAPGIVKSDIFMLYNPTAYSWSLFRSVYRAGEYCTAVSIDGFDVTIDVPMYDSYLPAAIDVYKLSTISPYLHNFTVIGLKNDNCIKVRYGRGVLIEGVFAVNSSNTSIQLMNCVDCNINDPVVTNYGAGGDDYGISIANCQHVRVNNPIAYARRHAVSIGGVDGVGSVTNRDVIISGGVLKNSVDSGVFAADMHGNCEDCEYQGCTIYGGITWQGRNTGYKDCTVYPTDIGAVLMSAELNGGDFYIDSCRVISTINPQTSGRGIIDVGGNNTTAFTGSTMNDCTFKIKNTSFKLSNMTSLTSLLIFKNRGSARKANFIIDNNEIESNALSTILATQLISGTADSDHIIVDHINCNLSGMFLHNPVGNAYLPFPMRLQRQSGNVTLTTTIGQPYTVGSPVTFKYKYPKSPCLTVSRHGSDLVGNRIGIPYANPLSYEKFTPTVFTDDGSNYTATENIIFSWASEINEY